jgi:hypothetical protein
MIDALATAVTATPPPPNALALFEEFAVLEILWERRMDQALVGEIVSAYQSGRPIDNLVETIDARDWEQVKAALSSDAAAVVVPPTRPQAYDPLTLRVTTGNPRLDSTFLFRFKLRYKWRITPKKKKEANQVLETLTPETLEPLVVQYLPRQGDVDVSLTVWNGTSDSVTLTNHGSLTIDAAETVPLVSAIERAEVGPLLTAGIIAIVTGMSLLYATNNVFGSMSDYLKLFLWGVAVDQGKNALQQPGK